MVREASDAGKDDAKERLHALVESALKVSGITGETSFCGELGVDSMQLVVLLLACYWRSRENSRSPFPTVAHGCRFNLWRADRLCPVAHGCELPWPARLATRL